MPIQFFCSRSGSQLYGPVFNELLKVMLFCAGITLGMYGIAFSQTSETSAPEEPATIHFKFTPLEIPKLNESDRDILSMQVEAILADLKNNHAEYNITDRSRRSDIERTWKDYKKRENQQWLETLSAKREHFLDIYLKYLNAEQEIQKQKSNLNIFLKEIEFKEKSIQSINGQKENTINLKKQLVEDFKSQLANITVSKTVLAKLTFSKGTPKERKEQLQDALSRFCVDQVINTDIQSYTDIQDTIVLKSVVSSKKGIARINDVTSRLKVVSDEERDLFLLIRCEVSPFLQKNKKLDEPAVDDKAGVADYFGDIDFWQHKYDADSLFTHYKYSTPQMQFVGDSAGSDSMFSMLSEKYKEYHTETSHANQKVEVSIKEIKYKYSLEDEKFRARITQYDGEIDVLNQTVANLRDSIQVTRQREDEETRAKEQLQLVIKQVEAEYRQHYEDRFEYVEKYSEKAEEENAEPSETKKALVKKIVTDLLADLRNIITSSNVIYTKNPSGTELKTQSTSVSYTPQLSAFKVLYGIVDDREKAGIYQTLSIAFRIKWKSYDDSRVLFSGDTLKDVTKKKLWWRKIKEDEAIEEILANTPVGFKLPTMKELDDLWAAANEYAEANDKGLFEKLKWKYEDYPFLTGEKDDNIAGYIVKNFYDKTTGVYDNTRSVYVVFVQDILE